MIRTTKNFRKREGNQLTSERAKVTEEGTRRANQVTVDDGETKRSSKKGKTSNKGKFSERNIELQRENGKLHQGPVRGTKTTREKGLQGSERPEKRGVSARERV